MIGVMFGDKHSYDDFGLLLNSKVIYPPEPKTHIVDIPGADGSFDLTESLTGDVVYKNRTLEFHFTTTGDSSEQISNHTKFANFIHGQKMEIVLDDDASYRYIGRAKITAFDRGKTFATITVICDVEPYKYDYGDDWLWDSFDFENDVANEVSNLAVNGTLTVKFVGRRKRYIPWIECSAVMTVTYNSHTYNLKAGKNKIFDIVITEGENTFIFAGNGVVSIQNRGGVL